MNDSTTVPSETPEPQTPANTGTDGGTADNHALADAGTTQPAERENDDTQETATREELLDELRSTPSGEQETPTPQPEDNTQRRREEGRKNHELRLKVARQDVEQQVDRGVAFEQALQSAPADLQKPLRRLIEGTETQEPHPEMDVAVGRLIDQKLAAKEDERTYKTAYVQIVEQAGLNAQSTHAIGARKRLSSSVERLHRHYGMPRTEAVELVAARMGLFDQQKLQEAHEQGKRLGAASLMPPGKPAKVPAKKASEITEENVDTLSLEDIERIRREKQEHAHNH